MQDTYGRKLQWKDTCSMFYEADISYIGSKSQGYHKQGYATEQQPFLCLLSTDKENSYLRYMKLFAIPKDNSFHIVRSIRRSAVLTCKRTLNTDGKYNI